jgi:CBS domain-containing protein
MQLRDIMTTEVERIHENVSLQEAAQKMRDFNSAWTISSMKAKVSSPSNGLPRHSAPGRSRINFRVCMQH